SGPVSDEAFPPSVEVEARPVLRGHAKRRPARRAVPRRGDRARGRLRSAATADRVVASGCSVLAEARPATTGRRARAGGEVHRAARQGAQGVDRPAEDLRQADTVLAIGKRTGVRALPAPG